MQSDPTRLRVPELDVDTDVKRLQLRSDGRVEVPRDPHDVGWYRAGGPSVLIGHVDSKTGPAAFFDLRELRPGSKIELDLSSGETKLFAVHDIVEVQKSSFPTSRVYVGDATDQDQPTIRLVTCGGSFDHSKGHYESNIIIFARQVRTASSVVE